MSDYEEDWSELVAQNARLRAALTSVKEWIMDPFGPEDFNSKSLHPAFTKALKLTHEALKDYPAMDTKEREFIAAADELYSAVAQGSHLAWPPHLRKAMDEFSAASNDWPDHPGKSEDHKRRK